MSDLTPPFDLEAEESVLGACLLSPKVASSVVPELGVEDFYKPEHRTMWSAMRGLVAQGKPVDPVTVADELGRNGGSLEKLGGKAWLFTLINQVPSPGSAAHYARIVREKALLRSLIDAAAKISAQAYSCPSDVEVTADACEQLIFAATQRRSAPSAVPMARAIEELMEAMDKAAVGGPAQMLSGEPTGMRSLDAVTGGYQPGNLVILAGRPSMGKSAAALQAARETARGGKPVLYFSYEMTRVELALRAMAGEAQVNSRNLKRGLLQEEEWTRYSAAIATLSEMPLYIVDRPGSVGDVASQSRRLMAEKGLGMVVIDYAQLMVQGSGNAVQELSAITRTLKTLAGDLDVPVVLLSQLSRRCEERPDKRPMLSDLRDSGSLEQDANVVIFLYRDEVYFPESSDAGMAEIIVSKHRDGPTGMVKVPWRPEWVQFG